MTPPKKRAVRVTLLIVGEGDAEVTFLRHLRALYGAELGRSVTIKNAFGGGGHQALQQAIREVRFLAYDRVVLMIDNDTHWTDADRRQAEKAKIRVIESSPCIEATLLKIAGHRPKELTADLKKQFANIFGCEAHETDYLDKHFGRVVVDRARDSVLELHDLMNHMGIAKQRNMTL
ncbi:hypothetical protein [Dyella sp. GSA-30]|jgi:hypothetical protein|uniref:hypothetical protein n=1 Tax=Dyella sp. GSA-30 TaxID=2994496 RepID=UPI002491313C|nr:hypothetical protein [Dyella sp. GSA-30]BDU22499.1 hypothetical protein DYGSA30_39560 [Dyella sp. GSA-30]